MQPAIYVTSLAAVEVLRARDGGQDVIDSVDVTCGLSLGEYTALAFAGAFRYSFCSVKPLVCYVKSCPFWSELVYVLRYHTRFRVCLSGCLFELL